VDIIDDNREPAINDDASAVVFVSVRNITGGNTDLNAEIVGYNRLSNSFTQITSTPFGAITNPLFNANPSVSGNPLPATLKVAWLSNANIAAGGSSNNADLNAEVYTGTYDGANGAVTAQLTRTTAANAGVSVNLLAPGRRMSRDGNYLAFESSSNAPRASGTPQATAGLYLVNISDVTNPAFTEIGPRATSGGDLQRFPTFTGDNSTLVWVSALDFNPDGTAPSPSPSPSPTTTTGLNPRQVGQLFSIPVAAPSPFAAKKLSETPSGSFGTAAIQHFPSNTTQRIAFSISGTNFGTGDNSSFSQVYYLRPSFAAEPSPSPVVMFLTGAANRMVVDVLASPTATPSPTATATPTPTPTPDASPTATPTPPVTSATPVFGLAPGMIGKINAGVPLAPSARQFGPVSGNQSPFFPVELNGVSVSVGGAAAGLLFVSPTEIQFQVPEGLAEAFYPIFIRNNNTEIRSVLSLVNNQPDIFTDPTRPGRAFALNITNTTMGVGTLEPFNVLTNDGTGRNVPTVLAVSVTGLQNVAPSQLTVRVGTTDITGPDLVLYVNRTGFPGVQEVWFRLPESLAGAGDVPVIVYLTSAGQVYSSAPEGANPPRIRIN
jgi:uncharacterized protein (TIGR03437 family)